MGNGEVKNEVRENREYSYLRHLCWGVLLNHDPERTWIAAMTEYAGYFDASGHPSDRPIVAVAGFIASEQQWLSFERAWEDALARYSLGDVFHMTDFEKQKRKDRGKVLDCLTDIINSHTAGHFSCAVEMAAYRKVNELYPLEEVVGTPYAIAGRGVARNINLWKEKNFKQGDNLLLFVEQGTLHQGDMDEAFIRDTLAVPQKVPKDHPSVQPADILAWEICRYMTAHDNRKSLIKLVNNHAVSLPDAHGTFRERELISGLKQIETVDGVKVPLRKDCAPNTKFVYHSSPKRLRRRTIK